MTTTKTILYLGFLSLKVVISGGLDWSQVKCSSDTERAVPDGLAPDVGRFPWLGVIQHSFYMGGKVRFAVTQGILIHPGYVIAPAEDIGKIPPEQMTNNTKFIVWRSAAEKFVLEVNDYMLHPEYVEQVTFATIALLELKKYGVSLRPAPVKPVCMPAKGAGSFDNLYAVKMTDETKELQKNVYTMKYVVDADCQEFYYRAQFPVKNWANPSLPMGVIEELRKIYHGMGSSIHLTYKKMAPTMPLCAAALLHDEQCIWDAGTALVARVNWAYWTLLGFGVRGPGCGAPARFVNVHDYLGWIDDVIAGKPLRNVAGERRKGIILRRLSPYEFKIIPSDLKIPSSIGECDRGKRGSVIYKDVAEITVNKNFAQAFYFIEIHSLGDFKCATIHLKSIARTNLFIWVEHMCHRDMTGLAPHIAPPDTRKFDCYIFFKEVAYVEFRFMFSFKADVELTVYGLNKNFKFMPNPNWHGETTDPWWPTDRILKWHGFQPYYMDPSAGD